MILAIEADGAGYRDSASVRDRDRLRKEHLERLGWRVHRLWSTAWFTDPAGELAKLRQAFDSAVTAAPPPPPTSASTSAASTSAASTSAVRAIPLGPGERPRLTSSSPRALTASPAPDADQEDDS
jgi:hypothetical protein